jgi:hypothetical protein
MEEPSWRISIIMCSIVSALTGSSPENAGFRIVSAGR